MDSTDNVSLDIELEHDYENIFKHSYWNILFNDRLKFSKIKHFKYVSAILYCLIGK